MKLSEYIKSVGDATAAELFRVEVRTAASWRRRERTPRPEKAAEIVEVTKGIVSYAEIYAPDDRAA